MAGQPHDRGPLTFMALVAILAALPGIFMDLRATPAFPDAPPAFDRFIASVQAATPATARYVVVADDPVLMFYRATYLLSPRPVYDASPAAGQARVRWQQVLDSARSHHAGYVLIWSSHPIHGGHTLLHRGLGTLVTVGVKP